MKKKDDNKRDMFVCPKCNEESHWGDWDYFTGKDMGGEIPSLGLDVIPFDFMCPECDEYSSREEIESLTKKLREQNEENQQEM